jgi:D-3-phosphoglycerate dehydrogenase
MKVVLLEPLGVPEAMLRDIFRPLEEKGHELVCYPDRVEDVKILVERAKDADVLMLANLPLPAEVINSCPSLKMISVAFTGVDHIALDACTARDIVVSNCAGYSTNSVAELAVGMMISLSRFMIPCDQATREGKTRAGLIGHDLAGKTVGIVGTGAIGMQVARICSAIGCKLIAYSRTEKDEAIKMGIRYMSLEDLMVEADIVSLHVPSTGETRKLINAEMIGRMKEDAILINTARGAIVDSEALAEALRNEKISGAGIDVFEMEPPIPSDHPLLNAPKVILAPHVAFATSEAFEKRAGLVFRNIEAWLEGEPVNRVN